MAEDIKVSVVMPARDAELTIGRAIRSLREQIKQPYEIIVVDNGSKDRTVPQALLEGTDMNLKVISCETPGSGAARNSGILASSGNLVAFLDADDVWYPSKLISQIAQITDIDSTFSGTYMHYLSPAGRILGDNMRFRDDTHAAHAIRAGAAMPVPLSSVLVGKKLVETVGLFNESFRRAQDLEWLTRVAAKADLTIAGPTPLVGYVLQAGSSSDDAYVEQGLAADAVRAALSANRIPDYQIDVVSRMASGRIPRKYAAGKHYRRAGILVGERRLLAAGLNLAKSLMIDPSGTLSKIRWQSAGRSSDTLDPTTANLFKRDYRS